LLDTDTDLWVAVHEERRALLDLLETLSPDQWNTPSLCDGWRVRDVVGHIVSSTSVSIWRAAGAMISSGFKINRYLAKDGRKRGAATPEELIEQFRRALPTTSHPPGQSSLAMLEDVIIHQIDIRLPLGHPRAVPLGRMRLVADYLDGNGFYPGKRLADGLRLEATDTDWATGHGPLVNGPIEALALTLSGRFVQVDQLRGEGLATLQDRISSTR